MNLVDRYLENERKKRPVIIEKHSGSNIMEMFADRFMCSIENRSDQRSNLQVPAAGE
jgi:hypothetical protein